jgi:GT2 family glycosyltransferase
VEDAGELAPPVVAVMVVHHPGSWFDDVLDGLARQDYADLKTLFLVVGAEVGAASEVEATVRSRLPNAFVERLGVDAGFGPTANSVLRLVEGDNGFFCFLHDDVALDPSAIRLMVEELYRSNAGVVGPKIVDWDDPRILQHVGFGADRFGEIDPIVERGEVDQEQHDAVRDVFGVPSACMLVRADLFRALGGFDRTMPFHGEDLDLCWRAHRSGARVVVVPGARARHREALSERRPDLAHETLRARHRMRTVLTLSAARRLPLLLVELVLLTLVELGVGIFTGRTRSGLAGLRALVGVVPRSLAIVARRRTLRSSRHVPDSEISRLQVRGSARFAAFLRSRDVRPEQIGGERRWRERAGGASVVAWACVVAGLVVGGRQLITGGVPPLGEFLPFGDSPRRLLRSYVTDWSGQGIGGRRPAPTGVALISVASVATGFRMGLLHTVGVLGMLLVGCLGIWRASAAFTTNRARIVTLVVYAAAPLPGQMISVGRWGPLVCYAAMPWLVDAMRRFAGVEPGRAAADREVVVDVPTARRVRIAAGASVVAAVAVAFEPSFALLLVGVAVVLAVATLLTGVHWVPALHVALLGVVATVVALVLNLPWIGSYVGDGGWAAIVGPRPIADRGRTALELASFDIGNLPGSVVALALYLPVVAGPLLGRGWRYGWAVRGGALVGAFVWLAVLDDRGSLPLHLPEPGIVLVPVALGLAISAGAAAAAFELDVRGGSFGWRQPLGLLASVAVVVGILPGLYGLSSGRWEAPRTTLIDLLGQLPEDPEDGEYRVLWIGDQRIVPVAGQTYRPGIAYALTDNATFEIADTWAVRAEPSDDAIVAALDAVSIGSTARAGRLLAPFAVRYVVIPVADGANSRQDDPLPVPAGLLDALGDQLDLGEVYSPRSNYIVYENEAWVPMRSVLTPAGADASTLAGPTALARADASGATPVMPGADELSVGRADLPGGTFHLAEPFDRGWTLSVDGVDVPSRPAFGSTTAFDVETPGSARLTFDSSAARRWIVAAQGAAWVLVLLVAINVRVPRRGRGGGRRAPVEPLIALQPPLPPPSPTPTQTAPAAPSEMAGVTGAAQAERAAVWGAPGSHEGPR